MTYSRQRAVSDGTLQRLDLTIGYIKRADISVLLNGVNTDNYTWAGSSNAVQFPAPIPNGVEVTLVRSTQSDKVINVFSSGAAFTNSAMDKDFQQMLYLAQEYTEGGGQVEFFSDIDMHGFSIHNVKDGVLPGDAVNFKQLNDLAGGAPEAAEAARQAAIAANAAAVRADTLRAELNSDVGAGMVSYIQPGTGVKRSVASRLLEEVSVLDFHLAPELDYSQAIQRAYDFLIAQGTGGIIKLPALVGGYQISTPLNFTNAWHPITLRGAGGTNIPDRRPNDTAFTSTLWGNTGMTCVIDISGRHNFGLEDLTIDTYSDTKCPNPSRIGVLGGRNTVSVDNQNHHFTNTAMFMKSTGNVLWPSICHYAYGTELGTYTNNWYFADVPAVYTKSLLYGVSSPYTTLLANGVSATCNVFNGMNYVTTSGLGPCIRLDNTYDNVFNGSYFLNDSSDQTYPAVMLTGTNFSLIMDGFQSEGHDNMFETFGSMLSCRINGFHIGNVNGSHIGKFNNFSQINDCVFEILEGGSTVDYQAYVGVGLVNSTMENVTFSLGDRGTANLQVGAGGLLVGLNFKKNGNPPDLYLRGGDGLFTYTLNGERRNAGIVHTTSGKVIAKSATANGTANAVASVTVPNESLTGTVTINYTVNSSSQKCVRTGTAVVSIARVAGGALVADVFEPAPSRVLNPDTGETLDVTFGLTGVFGGPADPNYLFVTCRTDSSLFGTQFFRATVDTLSASTINATLTDSQHLLLGS